MLIKEMMVLAGGMGTRLRSAVPDIPKCMAPVNGKPFISYLIDYFLHQGIEQFIFALGYKSEYFEDFINGYLPSEKYKFSIESEPLGTGGAIKLGISKTSANHLLITNGDTLYKADPAAISSFHVINKSHCTLCLKPLINFDRYGIVELDEDARVTSFKEKQFYTKGLINGGLYALDVIKFLSLPLPEKFSFEKDFLEKFVEEKMIKGIIQDKYFIDIGIPSDYKKVQTDLV